LYGFVEKLFERPSKRKNNRNNKKYNKNRFI
jgi:hypothetical protein